MQKEKPNLLNRFMNLRIAVIVGVLVLMISYLSFSGENKPKFKDVSDTHWASTEINYLSGKKIIGGYPDGTFKPNTSISRLHAVFMLLRAKGITDVSNVPNPHFADMNTNSYGYAEVAKAVELGIIGGKVNSKGQKVFDPNGNLTRAEMAKILSLGYNLTGTSSISFKDVPKNHWAYAHVQALAKTGITAGYGNGKFGANDFITRAEFSVMMARTLDEKFRVDNDKPSPTPTPTEPEQPNTGGVKYPDGWVAPVLKSKWTTPDYQTNIKIFEKELGFTNGGSSFDIPHKKDAIFIADSKFFSGYESTIAFAGWQNESVYESYRIPVIANELFKFYFEKDANRVSGYFDSGNVPDKFNANGRSVVMTVSEADGYLYMKIGYKK